MIKYATMPKITVKWLLAIEIERVKNQGIHEREKTRSLKCEFTYVKRMQKAIPREYVKISYKEWQRKSVRLIGTKRKSQAKGTKL